ncbi:hypothetical protein [Streptomyces sp. NPDC006333]|uniref:hypothetical protein n=1 Tax=Streptomyces sp. NPDC006333 TaxID=3156753 RepID=UPI0033B9F5EA
MGNRQATGDYYQTTLDRPTDDTFEDDLTEAWNNPPVTERYVLDLAYSRASKPSDDDEP